MVARSVARPGVEWSLVLQIATKKLQGNFNNGLNYIHILAIDSDVLTCQLSKFDVTKDMFKQPWEDLSDTLLKPVQINSSIS